MLYKWLLTHGVRICHSCVDFLQCGLRYGSINHFQVFEATGVVSSSDSTIWPATIWYNLFNLLIALCARVGWAVRAVQRRRTVAGSACLLACWVQWSIAMAHHDVLIAYMYALFLRSVTTPWVFSQDLVFFLLRSWIFCQDLVFSCFTKIHFSNGFRIARCPVFHRTVQYFGSLSGIIEW